MLYDVCSALTAIIVFIAWLKPSALRILVDKGSGEPALGRQAAFTALLVSSWAFVAQVEDKNLTEWYFAAYMVAWAGAQFGSVWLAIKGAAQGVTTVESKTESTVKTVTPAEPAK